jgi:hypothetical protein
MAQNLRRKRGRRAFAVKGAKNGVRHIIAYAIGAGMLYGIMHFTGDASRT